MMKIAIVLACLAFVGYGQQVGALPKGSTTTQFLEIKEQEHADQTDADARTSQKIQGEGTGKHLKSLAMMLSTVTKFSFHKGLGLRTQPRMPRPRMQGYNQGYQQQGQYDQGYQQQEQYDQYNQGYQQQGSQYDQGYQQQGYQQPSQGWNQGAQVPALPSQGYNQGSQQQSQGWNQGSQQQYQGYQPQNQWGSSPKGTVGGGVSESDLDQGALSKMSIPGGFRSSRGAHMYQMPSQQGYDQGYGQGYDQGYGYQGYDQVYGQGYDPGYDQGWDQQYDQGPYGGGGRW